MTKTITILIAAMLAACTTDPNAPDPFATTSADGDTTYTYMGYSTVDFACFQADTGKLASVNGTSCTATDDTKCDAPFTTDDGFVGCCTGWQDSTQNGMGVQTFHECV